MNPNALSTTRTTPPKRVRFTAFLVAALALSVGGAGITGCDDDSSSSEVKTAQLRVLHLSPNAPGVDVFLNGLTPPAVNNLAFPAGTGLLTVNAGTYDVAVSGTGSTPAQAVLTVNDLMLERGKAYTAVAYDQLSAIKALAIEENLDGVPAGQIRVRAIHTASGVGQVDIWNVPQGGTPSPLYPDFDFGEVGQYLTLPAGAYRLGVDVNNDANPDLLFNLPALPAGTVANVFAVASGSNVFLIAQFADGSTARINASV